MADDHVILENAIEQRLTVRTVTAEAGAITDMVQTFSETLRRLSGAQKGHARGAPAYSVYVNRKIGRILAAVTYRLGLTPNQVTMVSALFTFAGIFCLALVPLSSWLGFLVSFLLVFGYALDSADGQVARLRGGGSLAGEWLDHFVDAAKVTSLHLAVLIGLYRFADLDAGWLLVPIGFSIVAGVTFFGMILNDLLKGKRGVPSSTAEAKGTLIRSLVMLPTDYGLLCLVFLLWGWTPAFLIFYTALFAANAGFLVLAAVKWFRDMRMIDAAALS